MKLPAFIVVGTAKSGTSTLYRHLKCHPEIFVPAVKDLYFFSAMEEFAGPHDRGYAEATVKSFDDYAGHFAGSDRSTVAGEVATDYLYHHQRSIPSIRQHLGDGVGIYILLRNPIDRAFSAYLHMLRKRHETLTFREAIAAEPARAAAGWRWAYRYVEVGRYSRQVQAYLAAFPKVRVLIYEEFFRDLQGQLEKLFGQLGVAPRCYADPQFQYNSGRVPKSVSVDALSQRVQKALYGRRAYRLAGLVSRFFAFNNRRLVMDRQERELLHDLFAEDVGDLADVIGRRLDVWHDFS